MIKVGIIGAGSPMAGEIIRILINHPETDIISLYAPSHIGRNVTSVHHGLIGESLVLFSDKINPEELDVIFLAENTEIGRKILSTKENQNSYKIIDLPYSGESDSDFYVNHIGLSEINRKALVRGETYAKIPAPPLVPALIALVPLAKYMLLNSTLFLSLSLPSSLIAEFGKPDTLANQLKEIITHYQPSFNSEIIFTLIPSAQEDRSMVLKMEIDCSLSLDEIEKIYDEIYDDHNFTFITHSPVSGQEVKATQKCVIYLDKPSTDKLEISVYADGRMRGGAGDAVHVMNLFEGLYEKTGLQLKSSAYDSPSGSESSSWFA